MKTSDSAEVARHLDIGTKVLIRARTDRAAAYLLLKPHGLCIGDLMAAGFTEEALEPVRRGWREVRARIAAGSNEDSDFPIVDLT